MSKTLIHSRPVEIIFSNVFSCWFYSHFHPVSSCILWLGYLCVIIFVFKTVWVFRTSNIKILHITSIIWILRDLSSWWSSRVLSSISEHTVDTRSRLPGSWQDSVRLLCLSKLPLMWTILDLMYATCLFTLSRIKCVSGRLENKNYNIKK